MELLAGLIEEETRQNIHIEILAQIYNVTPINIFLINCLLLSKEEVLCSNL